MSLSRKAVRNTLADRTSERLERVALSHSRPQERAEPLRAEGSAVRVPRMICSVPREVVGRRLSFRVVRATHVKLRCLRT